MLPVSEWLKRYYNAIKDNPNKGHKSHTTFTKRFRTAPAATEIKTRTRHMQNQMMIPNKVTSA